jgi:hypothetical protein
VWHDAAVGAGVWLCVLPQCSGQKEPAVRYHDLAGDEVGFPEDDFSAGMPDEDESINTVWVYAEQVLRGAKVPALWPRQDSGGRRCLRGKAIATPRRARAGGWRQPSLDGPFSARAPRRVPTTPHRRLATSRKPLTSARGRSGAPSFLAA